MCVLVCVSDGVCLLHQQGWLASQHHHQQQTPQLLPSSFQLHPPPLGRRCRGSLALPQDQGQGQGQRLDQRLGQRLGQSQDQRLGQGLGQRLDQRLGQSQDQGQRLGQGPGQRLGMEAIYSQVNQRAEAVSRLKLLPAPNTTVQEQVSSCTMPTCPKDIM